MKIALLKRYLVVMLVVTISVSSFSIIDFSAKESNYSAESISAAKEETATATSSATATGTETATEEEIPIYLNETYSFEARAADLVSRMTLEEKISQIENETAAIPRLSIKKYCWWNEALHGVARSGRATSFPSSLSMSLSWDTELMKNEASNISDEARGYTRYDGKGLSYWSPTVNLARDPRWGRNEETYGEDPYLTSLISGAFVTGMQGDDSKYLKTISTVKHFMANNSEVDRHTGSSNMTDAELHNYYALPYRYAVTKAGVYSVMTGYNEVNGTPMSANTYLINTLLRKTWGFLGYIVSDCGAIADVYKSTAHNWSSDDTAPSIANAAGACITAGTDLACTYGDTSYTSGAIPAIDQGYLSEEDIDLSVYRLMLARMKTGEFDDNYGAYGSITTEEIEAADHTALAETASNESVVLLKNEDNILPLDTSKQQSVGIVGAGADTVVLGDYSGTPSEENQTTPLKGLKDAVSGTNTTVNYYDVGDTDERTFLFNYSKLELLDSNGQIISTLDANNYSSIGGGVTDEGNNIGYVVNGGYIAYSGVNLSQVASVRAYLSNDTTNAKGGVVELRYGSLDGVVVGRVESTDTTGWSDYQPNEGTYTGAGGGYNSSDSVLYLKFTSKSTCNLSESQLNSIANDDYAIVYAYTTQADSGEGESGDRESLDLPNNQTELIKAVAEVNPNTIVYIQAVGLVDVSQFKDSVKSIFFTSYNGQAQGKAFANLITGVTNPSGSLSFTWISDEKQLDDISSYSLYSSDTSNGRTYQYYTGDYDWAFGYGLSYTDFEVSNVTTSQNSIDANNSITINATVKNTGTKAGSKTVQLYVKTPSLSGEDIPIKRLIGFEKVSLDAGESKTISITVDSADLALWSESQNKYVVNATNYVFDVATSADNNDICGSVNVNVTGTRAALLQAVTLDTDGIIMDEKTKSLKSDVTVALDNDSIITEGYTVEYVSGDTSVATINSDGVINSVSSGATEITAIVKYEGQQMSSTIGVSVVVDVVKTLSPDSITFSGEVFADYNPEKTEYNIVVNDSIKAPIVNCIAKEGTEITVNQADSALPCVVTLTASKGKDSITYKFNFYSSASGFLQSDDFKSTSLDSKWSIIRESSSKGSYSYTAGKGLTITTSATDLSGKGGTATNIFTQSTVGDWSVETKLIFSTVPTQLYQQGGVLAYVDDDNYVKLGVETGGDYGAVKFQAEQNGTTLSTSYFIYLPQSFSLNKTIYFILAREGDSYTAQYSLDGIKYNDVGSIALTLNNPKFGLSAVHVMGTASPIGVTYEYVKSLTPYSTIDIPDEINLTGPKSIILDRVLFEGYSQKNTEYDIYADGSRAPAIEALAVTGTTVKINQINVALPSVATVYCTNNNIVTTYTFNFHNISDLPTVKDYNDYVINVPDCIPGDVDDLNGITAVDALLALKQAVNSIELSGDKFKAADVDFNGRVTASDALLLLQYSVKKIAYFKH